MGIIPARAGFTNQNHQQSRTSGDHPRSRGVYYFPVAGSIHETGSSPLARGLRKNVPLFKVGNRIIPARAGFTQGGYPISACTGDHPRSRGVYETNPVYTAMGAGSSPLARGLRNDKTDHWRRFGIIPARAGFTSPLDCRVWSWGDHPRSRGVYGSNWAITIISTGSSPLARGLLPGLSGTAAPGGIIPARAGFT